MIFTVVELMFETMEQLLVIYSELNYGICKLLVLLLMGANEESSLSIERF